MKTKYTHYAKYKGISCYYNEYTYALTGTNWIMNKLLDVVIFLEVAWPTNDMGFAVHVGEELSEDKQWH